MCQTVASLMNNAATTPEEDQRMLPWEDLTEEYRESNREQADWFPTYLDAVGCGFLPAKDEDPRHVDFDRRGGGEAGPDGA